jgi:hypothetical protein
MMRLSFLVSLLTALWPSYADTTVVFSDEGGPLEIRLLANNYTIAITNRSKTVTESYALGCVKHGQEFKRELFRTKKFRVSLSPSQSTFHNTDTLDAEINSCSNKEGVLAVVWARYKDGKTWQFKPGVSASRVSEKK